jgi:lipopolysaccharide transport system ATP-binding protein
MAEVLIKVEGVSKKFCRNLKRSLWYGVQDICADLNPFTVNGQPVETHSIADRKASHALNANGTTASETSGFNIPMADHGQNGLRRDEFWAVNNVSFELKRGECLGLIGRNGAGKTTLLKMLNGLIKPDHGRIEMHGRVGALIALGAGFNPILSGRENIYVNGAVLGLTKREIDEKIDDIIDFAEIREFIDSPVQSYSSGMQVRLGFSIATALKPDILLLDEVLAVGDAAFRVKCFNRMYDVLQTAAVIFVSHNMAQMTRLCSRMILLHHGRAVVDSSDLGMVVGKYHERMESGFGCTTQGTGRAQIHSVHIENNDGIKVTKLIHGLPFTLVVRFSILTPSTFQDAKLVITVNDGEQNNVAQIVESLEVPRLDASSDCYEMSMSFDRAQFNAGRFFVTASIQTGSRGDLACVVRNATRFVIEHSTSAYAPILLYPKDKVMRLLDRSGSNLRLPDNGSQRIDNSVFRFFVKEGYRSNNVARTYEFSQAGEYWTAERLQKVIAYQHHVYLLAAKLIEHNALKSALELGCGPATKTASMLLPKLDRLTLIDQPTCEQVVKKTIPSATFISANLEHCELDLNQQFDLIVCADVLEHLSNPLPCLEFAYKHLSSSGFAVFSTPERDILRGQKCMNSPHPSHVREWNRLEFRQLLDYVGFVIFDHILVPPARTRKVEDLIRFLCSDIITTSKLHGCQVAICRKARPETSRERIKPDVNYIST